MLDSFEYNLKVCRANKNFFGYRKKANKDELENKYTWALYEEANTKTLNFCCGLNTLDLCSLLPFENDDSFCLLRIYSKNKQDSLLSYFGTVRDSITIATVYNTLGNIVLELRNFLMKTKVAKSEIMPWIFCRIFSFG